MRSAGGIVLCNNNYTILCTPERPLVEVVVEAVKSYKETHQAFNQRVSQIVGGEILALPKRLREGTTKALMGHLKDPSLEGMCEVLLGFVPIHLLSTMGQGVPTYAGEDPCMFVHHQEVAKDLYREGLFIVEDSKVNWRNGTGDVPVSPATTMEDWYDLAKLGQRGCLKKKQFYARLDRVILNSQAMGAPLALAGKE